VFKQAIIHYPADEKALAQKNKKIAAFCCLAIIKYIEFVKLYDRQIEMLYAALTEEMAARRQESAKAYERTHILMESNFSMHNNLHLRTERVLNY
jgi:hypothetical protein